MNEVFIFSEKEYSYDLLTNRLLDRRTRGTIQLKKTVTGDEAELESDGSEPSGSDQQQSPAAAGCSGHESEPAESVPDTASIQKVLQDPHPDTGDQDRSYLVFQLSPSSSDDDASSANTAAISAGPGLDAPGVSAGDAPCDPLSSIRSGQVYGHPLSDSGLRAPSQQSQFDSPPQEYQPSNSSPLNHLIQEEPRNQYLQSSPPNRALYESTPQDPKTVLFPPTCDSSSQSGGFSEGGMRLHPPPGVVPAFTSCHPELDAWSSFVDPETLLNPSEECIVCLGPYAESGCRSFRCGHLLHEECMLHYVSTPQNYQCTVCKTPFRKPMGNQPNGTMKVQYYNKYLPGYESYGIILITYHFPDGKYLENGEEISYHGTRRCCYLPDSPEGLEVLALLRKAFDARLTFTIGTSITTGEKNCVIWNGIHHKTSPTPGPFGYPDPNYLSRVKEELRAKSIM